MATINDPSLEKTQVVTLGNGAIGKVYTAAAINRVNEAVTVKDKKVVFKFNNDEATERAWYNTYLKQVATFDENPAKPRAAYLLTQMAATPAAYTLAEIAFLCKCLTIPFWTLPIFQTFEAWENIARINPTNLPTVYEQLLNGGTTPQPDTGSGSGTGNGTGTPTPEEKGLFEGLSIGGFVSTLLGGLAVYFITKKSSN